MAAQRDMCIPIFIAVLFTVARTWKEHKCSLTEDWISKMEYYSVIKKKEILTYATASINPEDFMLIEISHHKKNNIV